jgi:hypothetical protein
VNLFFVPINGTLKFSAVLSDWIWLGNSINFKPFEAQIQPKQDRQLAFNL